MIGKDVLEKVVKNTKSGGNVDIRGLIVDLLESDINSKEANLKMILPKTGVDYRVGSKDKTIEVDKDKCIHLVFARINDEDERDCHCENYSYLIGAFTTEELVEKFIDEEEKEPRYKHDYFYQSMFLKDSLGEEDET